MIEKAKTKKADPWLKKNHIQRLMQYFVGLGIFSTVPDVYGNMSHFDVKKRVQHRLHFGKDAVSLERKEQRTFQERRESDFNRVSKWVELWDVSYKKIKWENEKPVGLGELPFLTD